MLPDWLLTENMLSDWLLNQNLGSHWLMSPMSSHWLLAPGCASIPLTGHHVSTGNRQVIPPPPLCLTSNSQHRHTPATNYHFHISPVAIVPSTLHGSSPFNLQSNLALLQTSPSISCLVSASWSPVSPIRNRANWNRSPRLLLFPVKNKIRMGILILTAQEAQEFEKKNLSCIFFFLQMCP